ncbi:MAG: hypothetical protein RJA68_694, partial [Actinomycetota bacterium]
MIALIVDVFIESMNKFMMNRECLNMCLCCKEMYQKCFIDSNYMWKNRLLMINVVTKNRKKKLKKI